MFKVNLLPVGCRYDGPGTLYVEIGAKVVVEQLAERWREAQTIWWSGPGQLITAISCSTRVVAPGNIS